MAHFMEKGSKAAIVCCSNGRKKKDREEVELLKKKLLEAGILPVFGEYIYEKESVFSGSGRERAESLMEFYRSEEIKAVFDISGGDIANEILPFLDFEVIGESEKTLWGYSDMTAVLNAIYAKTGKKSVLYQVRNLLYDETGRETEDFCSTVFDGTDRLFSFSYEFVQGTVLDGIVAGGNIRCLLKLAGTGYWPDMTGKVLLLEAARSTVPLMVSHLNQLEQMGVFEQIGGVLLGTFIEMEEKGYTPAMPELVKRYVKEGIPVVKTTEIGHRNHTKGIVIGERIHLER